MNELIVIGGLAYIIGIILLRIIHKFLLKRKKKNLEQCTFAYDNLFYLMAKEGWSSPISKLYEQKNKNYLVHHDLIINAIRDLEAQTQQILLNPEMEKNILRLRKKVATSNATQKIIGILLSILTLGTYLLIW